MVGYNWERGLRLEGDRKWVNGYLTRKSNVDILTETKKSENFENGYLLRTGNFRPELLG